MKICLLGGGGFVGHHLASLLAARGHTLTIPCRQRDRIKDLLVLPGVELIEADIHDPASLENLFRGQDAVINLVGILHGSRSEFARVHAELPMKVVQACRHAGVDRLLHMSALGASTESRSVYQQTKAQGEKHVLEATDLTVTVFRPSVIFGPGDSFLTLFADLLGLAPVVPLAGGHARFQPVYVGDVARAFADSLDLPESRGQVYSLCGPRVYTLADLVSLVARHLGMRRVVIPLGDTPSYLFARLMELKPGQKIMTRDNHYAMQADNVCPEGFPACFGTPAALETQLGYLRDEGPKCLYDRFRRTAGR